MPEEVKPKPQNADPEPPETDPAPGPKASGTFKRGVQPPNAEPENPDQNPGSGTGTKPPGTLKKDVEPSRG